MEYQFEKCLSGLPEEHKADFEKQQSAWEEYFENDIFAEIAITEDETGMETGTGYTREAQLIRLDRLRSRTLEIMHIRYSIEDTQIEFQYAKAH
jgi:hypothetical protein